MKNRKLMIPRKLPSRMKVNPKKNTTMPRNFPRRVTFPRKLMPRKTFPIGRKFRTKTVTPTSETMNTPENTMMTNTLTKI